MIHFPSRYVRPRITVRRIPAGQRGTLVTARMIARMIRSGARDFYVRQKAITVFRRYRVRPKDRLGEAAALFDFVRRNIRYTRDILGTELLHSARRMLELRAGDCDDMTILLGALLMATGHPVRLVLAGFRPNRPHAYSHIYPEVKIGRQWIAVDATVNKPMGWSPPAMWKRFCEVKKEDTPCSSRTP
ncbi:MAG: transglutaminase-like domain-containing protein [Longimicrobiales bacterium]